MIRRTSVRFGMLLVGLLVAGAAITAAGTVSGKFVVGGTDAQLKFVRAARAKLDAKTNGYFLLLSAREMPGELARLQTSEPKERGSFIFLQMDQKGEVWVAELGHVAAKTGRFGVVTEVKASGFKVEGDKLVVTLSTGGEQVFSQDHYSVDLKVEATIEH